MVDERLQQVVQAFDNWRSSLSSTRGVPIPQALWDQVRQISAYYKKTHICRALRINTGQFDRHVQQHDQADDAIAFVRAQIQSIDQSTDQAVTMTLQGPHHRVELNVPEAMLSQVLSQVGKLL